MDRLCQSQVSRKAGPVRWTARLLGTKERRTAPIVIESHNQHMQVIARFPLAIESLHRVAENLIALGSENPLQRRQLFLRAVLRSHLQQALENPVPDRRGCCKDRPAFALIQEKIEDLP